MFKQAHVKLAFFYSLFFLLSIWLVSSILYIWMQHYFQQEYAQELQEHFAHQLFDPYDLDPHWSDIAATVAFNQFKLILFLLNAGLLFFVPTSAWLLTGRSLKPIEDAHVREKQFVTNAAHDLRTPLTIMSGEMEVVLQKQRKPLEYQQVIKSSQEEVQHLIRLVEDLLFLARHDSDNTQSTMLPVDVVDLVNEVATKYILLTKTKNIELTVKLPEEGISVNGNKTMLDQLIRNLMDNAVKYTERGKIVVTVSKLDQHAVITITDSGIGIAEQEQKNIFNRFYRIDSSRSLTKGYGLGLSISQSIVTLHRGEIKVTSRLNHGSTFHIKLPLS